MMKYAVEYTRRNNKAYREFMRGSTRVSYPPVGLWVESTNYCNLRCVKCAQHYGLQRPQGFMEKSLFRRILDQAQGRILHMTVNGIGEALLHPEIFDRIRWAKEAGIPQLFLHTNATLLNERRSLQLLESGLDNLMISFDSEFPEEYERSHVGARYEKTLRNIVNFLMLKRQKGLQTPMVSIKILRVFQERAADRDPYPSFLHKFNGLPVDRIFVASIHATGSYVRELSQVNTVSRDPIDRIEAAPYSPCLRPFTGMSITWDGKVNACFQDYRGEYAAGDLTQDGLMDIWNGPALQSLRSRLHNGPPNLPVPCASCSEVRRFTPPESSTHRSLRRWIGFPKTVVRYHMPDLRRYLCRIPAVNRLLDPW